MDSALVLKKKAESGEITGFDEAKKFLETSSLIKLLLEDFNIDVLNLLNRLTEISEIPFTAEIPKVRSWVDKLADISFTGNGFSITGKSDDILSCYNAMVTSVLIRLGYSETEKISEGIGWILQYQNFERGKENLWSGSRIHKYGGCLKSTPCYIGIVKSLIALTLFKKSSFYNHDHLLEKKLQQGLEYILEHKVFKRMAGEKSITADIEKITYPFSYKTNIIEILRLLKENLVDDPRCEPAKEILQAKRNKNGYWQVNHSYLPKHWILFDKVKEPGLWVSYEIEKLAVNKNTKTKG